MPKKKKKAAKRKKKDLRCSICKVLYPDSKDICHVCAGIPEKYQRGEEEYIPESKYVI